MRPLKDTREVWRLWLNPIRPWLPALPAAWDSAGLIWGRRPRVRPASPGLLISGTGWLIRRKRQIS